MRYLALILILTGRPLLATVVRGQNPDLREVMVGDRTISADAATPDHVVGSIQQWRLTTEGHNLLGVWSIPGRGDMYLAFAEGPDTPGVYGPQVLVLRVTNSVTKLFESRPMMDADDFVPTFFPAPASTLVLADFGNEDVWGIRCLNVSSAGVRDLGILPLATPPEFEFTRSAIPDTVELRHGRFVITFACPLLLNPGSRDQRRLGKKGESLEYEETKAGFRRRKRPSSASVR